MAGPGEADAHPVPQDAPLPPAGSAAPGQPRSVDVLVVGGGLGGLALAIGLQSLGLDWLLAEAAQELRTATGTLIGLGDNGFHALGGISPDIPPALKAAAQLGLRSASHERPDGGPATVKEIPMSSPLYTIRWGATQNVLASLVDQSRVLCGHKCTGWQASAGRDWVTVSFMGQPDIRARFVVGADGVRSAVRAAMVPADPGPRYLGFMNWNAVRYVPSSGSGPDADLLRVISDKQGSFRTMVYLLRAGCDYLFWQVRMTCDGEPAFTSGSMGGGGVPGSKARVLQRLREHGWEDAAAEVEATDEAAIYERAMWDRVPLGSWSAAGGRVVLLGDAAHAMYSGPGQGARTAFEDAHQLFLALKAGWPDAAAVAAQYEEARIARATVIQNIAAAMANIPGGVSKAMAGFWGSVDPHHASPEELNTRFSEVARWMNAYPAHMHGLPGAKYAAPGVLAAFNAHCAAAAAAAGLSHVSMAEGDI